MTRQRGGRALLVGLMVTGLVALIVWSGDIVRASVSTVSIVDFAFQSTPITVNVGDTVTWRNDSPFSAHTTTSATALWDSHALAPGQTFSFTFTSPGTYNYACTIHAFMMGSVTVLDTGGTPTFTPTVTPTATPPVTSSGPQVQVTVARAGTNRLQVTVAARPGETLSGLAWTLPANAAAESLTGASLPTGVTLPAGTTSASFILRRVSGQGVTLPIVVTGSFGTWRTFAGGGPSAW